MPDETDMPLPVIPVNLPDDTQATTMPPEASVEAVAPSEAPAESSAPVEEEKAPHEAPAVSDKLHATITVDTSAIAPLLADMQHELAAARDAAANAQAAHDRVKDAHDQLLAEFQAAAEELEMRRALPSTEHFQAQIDSLQQRLTESDAKVQALTEERDLLKAAQPA